MVKKKPNVLLIQENKKSDLERQLRLSNFLRNFRLRSEMTPDQAAKALGVSRASYFHLENTGTAYPRLAKAWDLFSNLGKLTGCRAVDVILELNTEPLNLSSKMESELNLARKLVGIPIKFQRLIRKLLSNRDKKSAYAALELALELKNQDEEDLKIILEAVKNRKIKGLINSYSTLEKINSMVEKSLSV